MGVIPEICMINTCDIEQNTHTCMKSLIHLCDTEMGVIYVILGWPKKTKFLIFSKNMKYVSYMNYLRPMIILESLKTPPRLCTIDFNFTKDFAQKYKGNNGILVFWKFLIILFLWNDFKSLRSFCLIDTLLLIPILP